MGSLAGPVLRERDVELSRIDDFVGVVRSGTGATLAIEGPAGIGKTRLLEAACARAQETGLTVLRARPGELERELGWGVVRDLLEPRLHALSGEERDRVVTGAARFALPVLGHGGEVELPAGTDGLAAALHGLYWLTANLAELGGLILAVDDAHWADEPSRRWLLYLAARVADLPVGLTLCARPAEPGGARGLAESLPGVDRAALLRPASLTEEATGAVVRETLGPRVESGFVRACFEATGGNPFVLGELAAELRRSKVVPVDVNASRVRTVGPRAPAASTLRGLEQLDPAAGKLADAVAVLGARVPITDAAALAGLDEEEAARAADALADAGILMHGLPLEFVHPLLRAAVYERQPKAQVALRHREAAALLAGRNAPDDAIAVHLLAVDPRGDPGVVTRLLAAAEGLIARGAPMIAAGYLRRALQEPASDELRPSLMYRLGQAEAAAMGPAGMDVLERAVELCEAPDERAAIALEFSRAARMLAEFPRAVRVLERVVESLEPGALWATRLEGELINVAILDLETSAAAQERLGRYRDPVAIESLRDAGLLADLALSAAASAMPRVVATGLARRAIAAMADREPDPSATVYAACALLYCDEFAEARALWDAFLAHSRSTGSVLAYGFGSCFRAQLAHREGQIREAEEDARVSVAIYAEWPTRTVQPETFLAEALVERGALGEAAALLGADPAEELPGLWDNTQLLYTRGRIRLHDNRPGEALSDLRECGRRLARTGSHNPSLLPWRSEAALALGQLGEREEAGALADEELKLAQAAGAPRALGVALRVAGLVRGGDDGIDLLRQAVDVLASSGAPVEHARALCEIGAALRRSGHPAPAREPLRQALELAARTGASRLADRARGELVIAGARPRRDRIEGRDALTAGELRVATMAAAGLSNREIAQSLFVTRRTVEAHLTSVYRKLDIASRAELGTKLPAAGRQTPT